MSDSDTNAGDAGDAAEPGDTGDVGGDDGSGFDKEAEREKLREKFARDEEKRESTRRMSELLLKGATMTNRHCDTCGDPLFRQNDQEFCVTCQAERPVDDGAVEGEAGAVQADAQPGEGTDADAPRRDEADAGTRATEPVQDERSNDDSTGRSAGDTPTTPRRATEQRRTPPSQAGSTDGQPPATGSGASTAGTGGTGNLDEARDALVAALTRHAAAGADTDDARTARDHLAAAREAAEALAALRR